jgi:hypothetical protein
MIGYGLNSVWSAAGGYISDAVARRHPSGRQALLGAATLIGAGQAGKPRTIRSSCSPLYIPFVMPHTKKQGA